MSDASRAADAELIKYRTTIKRLWQERDGLSAQVRRLSDMYKTLCKQAEASDVSMRNAKSAIVTQSDLIKRQDTEIERLKQALADGERETKP